ncbi:MAG: twin-arginine translocation signal domain-containing protein [Acidobacteriaceae bacterium]
MSRVVSRFIPQRKNAILRQIGDEFLVYDKDTDRAHCLNEFAGPVWKLSDGTHTVADIAKKLRASSAHMDEDLVWMALTQLAKAGLLLNRMPPPGIKIDLSRRALIQKVGVAAALALPAVASIVVPTPAEAVSCLKNGKPCTLDSQCCSGRCNNTHVCSG